jgi:hypothetical protein
MKCEICSQDVENSQDLEKHKEQAHPKALGDKSMDSPERPDLLADAPEESAASGAPQATH